MLGATGEGSGAHMGFFPVFYARPAAYLPQAKANGLYVKDAQRSLDDFSVNFMWDDEAGDYSLLFDDELIQRLDAALQSKKPL